MNSIFITGIAGLLGSNLAKYFLKKGYIVSGIDNLVGGYADNIPKGAYFQKVDIISRVPQHGAIDSIKENKLIAYVHCAALAHEGLSVFSPYLISNNIYSGTIAAYTHAVQCKADLFINFSSMARYGNVKPPFTESTPCNPVDPYGLAKYQVERQLNLLSEIHGIPVVTVVPHNVIGPGQVYTDPYRNVASIMMNNLFLEQKIYIYGDGKQKRSFSHVDDCVNSVAKIIENQTILGNGEIVNIGPDKNEITINDLAELVQTITGVKGEIIHLDSRPREVRDAWCSSDKAKSLLEYKAEKSIEICLLDIRDFILTRGYRSFEYNLNLELPTDKTPKTWTDKLFGTKRYINT